MKHSLSHGWIKVKVAPLGNMAEATGANSGTALIHKGLDEDQYYL
jgi:hypothetical protein